MSGIDRDKHMGLACKQPPCRDVSNTQSDIIDDLENLCALAHSMVSTNTVQYAATWILDHDLKVQAETNAVLPETEVLSRGRVVFVNPGVDNIGREQRYIHCYIVLAEFKETFIGVPITNMAYNRKTNNFYLRNVFEVELVNPPGPKPYTEFRCIKRSIADIRNISGLDKRRIIKNKLFQDKRFVPNVYMTDISRRIMDTIAIFPPTRRKKKRKVSWCPAKINRPIRI